MVLGVMAVVLLLAVGAIAITLRSRSRPRPSSPSNKKRLTPGETCESGTLDHPDLLEAESHVPTAGPYRSAEVTQAVSSHGGH